MLHDGHQALVVDPGDSLPVKQALAALKLDLVGILVTHHHNDHVGGVPELREILSGKVFAPANEAIPGPNEPVSDGQTVAVGPWEFQVIGVPGHTAGHVAYVLPGSQQPPILFCGDTLFSGGCGRLFEGTPEQMLRSLHRLAGLPPDTRVCCSHEYTLANLRFAAVVEPNNPRASKYLAWCERQRQAGKPTLPSSIELESNINPFLRCNVPAVVASAQVRSGLTLNADFSGELAVFTVLRKWKNEFRT